MIAGQVVRHGKAEARKLWKGSDAANQIDHAARRGCGAEPRAGGFNPTRPAIACAVQTLQMFACTGRDMVHLIRSPKMHTPLRLFRASTIMNEAPKLNAVSP